MKHQLIAPQGNDQSERDAIIRRYSKRAPVGTDYRYTMLNPDVLHAMQERQRVIVGFLKQYSLKPLSALKILEVGCGDGSNILELLRIGCCPSNIVGNDLLADRLSVARRNLPQAVQLYGGDASNLVFDESSFDIVYQSTVFSSLLDDKYQELLASRMWSWVRPGGAVLWYDFIYNNPVNPNVRGVPPRRVQDLFSKAHIYSHRVTLAPPLSRRFCRVHPSLYTILNMIPWLRTHFICWLQKI